MYDDILLPVDDSDGADRILQHVGEIADRMDATVQLLFVADTNQNSVAIVGDRAVDTLRKRGEEIVDRAGETLETFGVEYDTDVVQGNPAPAIVDYAEQYDHDLIVMPTHGREGLSRYLLGSVTEKVVRLASAPVLTARMQADEQLTFPYENVLIPTDGSAAATTAATHGLALADTLDASVHVLSVVDDSLLGPDIRSATSEQELERAGANAVDNIVSAAEERGLTNIEGRVERGTPANVIRDTIKANDIDVVVMGTTGRRGVDRILLGSVAEKTVRSAPVPVITVAEQS